MTTTINLNLKKPEQSDGINIADINGNMDTLDLEIKGLREKFSPEGKAKDADRLGGMLPSELALRDHNHSGVYAPATHSHTPAESGATPAAHGQDGTIHVTVADKNNWNGKAAGSHVSDTVLHTTQAEKNKWNGTANTWVATSVTMSDNDHCFGLTVPNFVFSEGCSVTFKAPKKPIGNGWGWVQINGGAGAFGFALRTMQAQMVDAEAWATNTSVTVTLSTQIFQVSQSGDGRYGTAFFKAGGASTPKFPTYTGSHALFGTDRKGYIEIYSSGTLTAQANMNVEAFLVGGGGGGGGSYSSQGGGGGGGGFVKLLTGLALTKDIAYTATIGAGGIGTNRYGAGSTGGTTSIFGNTANGGYGGYGSSASPTQGNGGNGGSGGGCGGFNAGDESTEYVRGLDGGYNGAYGGGHRSGFFQGGIGSGVSTIFNGKAYSGGGGGGAPSTVMWNASHNPFGWGNSGSGNGGSYANGGANGQANTGGGAGGGGGGGNMGGTGGSGIIIIRWGY